MQQVVLYLPSADGHGEYDLYAQAPAGMSGDQAREIVNAEIQRANLEDERNADEGGDGCNDGLTVEESIKAALQPKGFVFFKPVQTYDWDRVP